MAHYFPTRRSSDLENLIKRIIKHLNCPIPSSESWHKDLLELAVLKKIISFELSQRLNEYLAFRHFFRHGYGIDLDKRKLLPLAQKIFPLCKDLECEIQEFLKSYNSVND